WKNGTAVATKQVLRCAIMHTMMNAQLLKKVVVLPETKENADMENMRVIKSAEGCPSTSLAREAVKDLYNTILDLNNCIRFDGSSGKQRCDAERYWECFKMAEDHIRFPNVRDKELLAEDCKGLESVDSCTKYMEIGGCSDESKQRFQYLKSDFASLRFHLCDPNLHTSMLEWNQCLNKSALESCLKLLPHDNC
ncbi:hypothetical protein HPB47_012615, partial [Ixodes persulcatus]